MDVLGLYLLQRVSDQIVIDRNGSFENRFVTRIPDSTAAKVEGDTYLTASKEVTARVTEGVY